LAQGLLSQFMAIPKLLYFHDTRHWPNLPVRLCCILCVLGLERAVSLHAPDTIQVACDQTEEGTCANDDESMSLLQLNTDGHPKDLLQELFEGGDSASRSTIQKSGIHRELILFGTRKLTLAAYTAQQHRFTKLQILGMFDSGTNLLGATLEANMDTALFDTLCPDDPGSSEAHGGYHCHWWKHAGPPMLHEELQAQSAAGEHMLLLAMVRSPLSHIASLEKAPYDLETTSCIGIPLSRDEERSCTIPNNGGTYHGLTDLWNSYVREYDELRNRYPEHEVLVIEYERLALQPEEIVADVARLLGEEAPKTIATVEEPAKGHGDPVDRKEAASKIINMTYMEQYDESLRLALCTKLSDELEEKHSVPIPAGNRSYRADCRAST